MTKRAQSLINSTYGRSCPPAIAALVEFASQNSGIDPRNYYTPGDRDFQNGLSNYREELRSIGDDYRRFRMALATAARENVTEGQVIMAGQSAFSGRLNYLGSPAAWEYTTGQYFPTEYRKAAASVLETAIRETRRSREPA